MRTMPYNISIPSTTSIRSSLSSSKTLTTMFDKTSEALTTGKKVNSSYDNSTLYFKDMRLSESAEAMLSVIDGLSNITSGVNSAVDTLESITNFLKQAKAAAESGLDEDALVTQLVGKNQIIDPDMNLSEIPFFNSDDEIIVRTGDADKIESDYLVEKEDTLKDFNIVEGEELKIKVGEEEWITLEVIDEDMTVSDFFYQVSEKLEKADFNVKIEKGKLSLETADRSAIILDGDLAQAFGFNTEDTYKIKVEEDWTVWDLNDAFSKIDGINASVNKNGFLEVTSIYGDNLSIFDVKGSLMDTLGISGTDDGGNNTTENYANMYNEALRQIDNLVDDAFFNGVNLLEGDSIQAIFDEEARSIRTINGVKVDSESLGLPVAENNWENADDIIATLDAIESALTQTEKAINQFDRDSYMIQSREVFLEATSNNLLFGAETLTGADLEAVAAEQLAIQTQKDLVNQVISITMQSNSSVLKLF